MMIEYSVLLNNPNGNNRPYSGQIEVDTELGILGDKDYNKKVSDAINKKHPNCKILDFGSINSELNSY